MKLLSSGDTNTKLRKSSGKGLLLFGLSLRAANGSGYEVCVFRTAGCTEACVLEFAGRSNMPNVRKARTRKTRLYFENRPEFLRQLNSDLTLATKQAKKKGLAPCVRLNVASDIAWEIKHPEIFANHPEITFYDYTKWTDSRFGGKHPMPENYHLTYSHNEETPVDECGTSFTSSLLARGINCAVVFDTEYKPAQGVIGDLPTEWSFPGDDVKYEVIDGDKHDIRLPEFDGMGVIVGLRGKGGKRQVLNGVSSGFILPTVGGISQALCGSTLLLPSE
tara:strand:- start:2080 stop:2910 length:831 start_codon:yes stop_codon:yes gene_type:complete